MATRQTSRRKARSAAALRKKRAERRAMFAANRSKRLGKQGLRRGTGSPKPKATSKPQGNRVVTRRLPGSTGPTMANNIRQAALTAKGHSKAEIRKAGKAVSAAAKEVKAQAPQLAAGAVAGTRAAAAEMNKSIRGKARRSARQIAAAKRNLMAAWRARRKKGNSTTKTPVPLLPPPG